MHATALHEEPPTMFTNSENLHGISIAGSASLTGFWSNNYGFKTNFWIRDTFVMHGFLDSRWAAGFTVGSWLHDGFLDSRRSFAVQVHDVFWDSRCALGFTMGWCNCWEVRQRC